MLTTRQPVLAVEEEPAPREDFGQVLAADSMELSSRGMAVMSDQTADY